jgi:uncharacterized tellurite resistance protein B-like protein
MDKELYLKTAFCCMACDGNIAEEEVQLIRDYTKESLVFQGLDVEKLLNDYIKAINATGMSFLNSYLSEIKSIDMTETEELQLVKIAIQMIEADKEVLYSEIKFFKRIRKCLSVSDEVLNREFPDKEDFFLPDIAQQEYEFVLESEFASIQFSLEDAQ